MKEIEVGDVYYLKGKSEKLYIVSNIEVHLTTDIFEKNMTIITLNNNDTGDEIVMPLSEFWDMFKHVKIPKVGDRVHVELMDCDKVDFYATLGEEQGSYRYFSLNDCTKEEFEGNIILRPHLENYGLGKKDFYTVVKEDKVVYMAGHILNQAMVEYREKQHNEVEGIKGVKPYSPHQDKSINDKSNAEQTKLAERILNNDFKAIKESDVFLFDVLNEGLGTIAELGIVLGMKHQAQETVRELEKLSEICMLDVEGNLTDTFEILQELIEEQQKILDKPVFCYCSDIRQGHGKPYNDPDRAEFSTNQFIFGMILSLTDGEGFISWEEVKERLKNL